MKTGTTSITNNSVIEIERDIIGFALNQGYSLALWRLPHQSKTNLILSRKPKLVNDLTLEEFSPGFAFAPFDPAKPKYYLEADHWFEIGEDEILEVTPGQFIEQQQKAGSIPIQFYVTPSSDKLMGDETDFMRLVEQSIHHIASGLFEKVVPSMKKEIEMPRDFDLLNAFHALCFAYPSAMVSLVSDSQAGTWMGASPELLVSTTGNEIFKTVALAGTQLYKSDVPLKNIRWTQKEIEEQALVERYIISCFKKIRVREYDEHGPKTVQAGNLIHLKSDFEVNMKDVNFPTLGSVMLKLLHPTSAVCGMPMAPSFKFLQENESYDREFYSGFLGPVNLANESHLFVNLRCLKWCKEHLNLYAGAGVTIDSEPPLEMEEVEMKMETILKVLGLEKNRI